MIPLLVGAPPRPARLLRLLLRKPATGVALLRFLITGIAPATRAAKRDDAPEAIRRFGTAVLGADAFARLEPQRMEQVRANYLHAELLGSGLAPLEVADLARVRAPALLIGGDDSPPLFRMLLDEIEAFLPRSERATIPNASHLMHEDDPTTFERIVVDFLGRHST